jgi:hypothetical protein
MSTANALRRQDRLSLRRAMSVPQQPAGGAPAVAARPEAAAMRLRLG